MARDRGSGRGKARARGRERGAHETQECRYPLRSRRQMMSSRVVSPQLIDGPPSRSVNRNPRILDRERETAEAECSHGSSLPTGEKPVIENIVEDDAPPILTGSASYCGPSTKKEDGFCAERTSRVKGHYQDVDGNDQPPRENTADPFPSFNMTEFARGFHDDPVDDDGFCGELTSRFEGHHQDVDGLGQPSRENIAGLSPSLNMTEFARGLQDDKVDVDGFCAELTLQVEGHHQDVDGDDQPPRENTAGPSPSFNMTEYVRGLPDDSADEEHEVESPSSVGYEDVHGYKVKIELAGLVGAIFGRYGDIVVECNVKSPSFLPFFFDCLCVIYQTLEEKKLSEITREQINEMIEELHFFKSHQLNVEWLIQRLELICEAKSRKYLEVKEEAEKYVKNNSVIEEALQQRREYNDLLQMKISAMEQEKEENDAMISGLEQKKVENQAKVDECTQMAIDIKTRVQALANQSLVHGLL